MTSNYTALLLTHTRFEDLNGQEIVISRFVESLFATKDFSLTIVRSSPGYCLENTSCRRHGFFELLALSLEILLLKASKLLNMVGLSNLLLYQLLGYVRSARISPRDTGTSCSAIVACTGGDLVDFAAALILSKRYGIRLFLYYFDDFYHQALASSAIWSHQTISFIAHVVESECVLSCEGVIVTNEVMRDVLRKRISRSRAHNAFSANIHVVRNPATFRNDILQGCAVKSRFVDAGSDFFCIVYTGSIYDAQIDSILSFASALDILNSSGCDSRVELHIYSHQLCRETAELLESRNSVRVHAGVSSSDSIKIQRRADLLLLPLSHDERLKGVVNTASPAKFTDYLFSGVPVFVYAPSGSFVVGYCKRKGCAFVSSSTSQSALSSEILFAVKSDKASILAAAYQCSYDFSLPVNSSRLAQILAPDLLCVAR